MEDFVVKRFPKAGFKSPMSKAAQMTALTREAAQMWVEREERRTGSRMAAYHAVASMFGASPDWLRKFIKGDEAKQPDWVIGWNILSAYQRLCERIERETENDLAVARNLRRKIDAAAEGFIEPLDGLPRTQASGARLPPNVPPEAT
jgi:hypothetical protein